MTPVLPALFVLAVHAATLSTASVPAAGRQEATLTLDAPGAVHLSARSASGTSCEVIDRVRGSFANAGSSGSTNCELDLLLDAGEYKVRLESSKRGKGQVALAVRPFEETRPFLTRLVNGSSYTGPLKPGQQASFWVSLGERGRPLVRVAGRNAGDVRLWRNGQWLEPGLLAHQLITPRAGEPMHEWWLDRTVEAGDYLLVVYGRDATTVTNTSRDDSLVVQAGYPSTSATRMLRFTLDASGTAYVAAPRSSLIVSLSPAAALTQAWELRAGVGSPRELSQACRIEKSALLPSCALRVSLDNPGSFLVRGPPHGEGTLEWSIDNQPPHQEYGSQYGSNTMLYTLALQPGAWLVSVREFPRTSDGVPRGCMAFATHELDPWRLLAADAPGLEASESLEREFNYDGSNAVLWFDVTGGGSLLQRAGVTSRRFKITTTGGLKNACEVYSVDGKGLLKRLTTSKGENTGCNETLTLEPGRYQLSLSGGLSGVESLHLTPEGVASPTPSKRMGSCQLDPLTVHAKTELALALNDASGTPFRAFEVTPLPLTGAEPLHVTLDPGRSLAIPVRFKSATLIESTGSGGFGCALESGAVHLEKQRCEVPAGEGTLTVSNPGGEAIELRFGTAAPPPTWNSPVTFSPTLIELPKIAEKSPAWFDFPESGTQVVTFEVSTPGLYQVTTKGLLSTSCRLRTPVIDSVAQDRGSGRGRNCLLQTYLQRGKYLFTASTEGRSRGRGAMWLERKAPRVIAGLSGEGDDYYRVGADELVQQKLVVKSGGSFELSVVGQGTSALQCRLDDPDGWPMSTVPAPCTGARELKAGTWVLTQLPLTVESMRHTRLARVREPVVLKGNKPHPVQAFTWYQAELGPDGKDEFLFTLEGETELDVVLTGGMQGRVYALEKDKAPRAVEVVPPMVVDDPGSEGSEAEAEAQPDEDYTPPSDEESDGEYSEDEGADAPSAAPGPQLAQATAAPPPPSGVKLTLPAGSYKLLTEHSRGDVGISYQLHLGSAVLLPGMTRTLPAPSRVPFFVPRDGTLRLRTEGEVDVRCRVLDERGQLVLEGNENGADWNCALAEPIRQGRYTLLLESETQATGQTTVSLALPPVEDRGVAVEGTLVKLGAAVASFSLPLGEKDSVQELSFSSRTPISCAIEDGRGEVVERRSRVTTCALWVRPKLEKYRLRLWTTDGTASGTLHSRSRPIVDGTSLSLSDATRFPVPHAGRFRTGSQIFCIAGEQTGVLRPCGLEVSLEQGSAIFATGPGASSVSPQELTVTASEAPLSFVLDRLPLIATITASQPSLFLAQAEVQHGERAAPSCAFDEAGSVRERRDDACFAVSHVGTRATARLWSPLDGVDARLVRRAITFPTTSAPLTPGRQHLTFSGAGRYALPPNARARLELTLSEDTWAALLDASGAAIDLCGPSKTLRRCVLTGQGGSLVLMASAGAADVSTVILEGAPARVAFTGLYEASPRAPGTVRLEVPPSPVDRTATIEGALHCTVALADGTRLSSCRARIPNTQGAELLIEHGVAPVRAMVHAAGKERAARFGLELPVTPGPGLQANVAVPVAGGRLDRTLVVDRESVVRVAADSGVCALFRGSDLLSVDGLDQGCELIRVLAPGTYRLLVRPFAGVAQSGTVRWSAEQVTQLTEGVGAESWLAPGEVRLFRFDAASRGKVGLGLQSRSELLECAVYNDGYLLLGQGCQQYLTLDKGRYLLTVRNAPTPGATPLSFKPVLLGLSGDHEDVPEDYLRSFFNRVGDAR